MTTQHHIGQSIATARRAAGLSQTQLARRLDVADTTVSRWETGAADPSLATLRRLATALEVTVSSLVEENEL